MCMDTDHGEIRLYRFAQQQLKAMNSSQKDIERLKYTCKAQHFEW